MSTGMSRFDTPEASNTLYVVSLSGSYRASFVYVHQCYIFSRHDAGLILYLRGILGHSRFEWVRKKHDSKACFSHIRPHGGEYTH
jgi:hypothetical protein